MNKLNDLEFINNWYVVKHLGYLDEAESLCVGKIVTPEYVKDCVVFYKGLFSSDIQLDGEKLVLVNSSNIFAIKKNGKKKKGSA